ncbi:MAG TPA: hypothetical protein VEK15_27510 [Vicinamibacteria bacterium]|nr:hypothetical protein [Vicinamibacteria bacterium]
MNTGLLSSAGLTVAAVLAFSSGQEGPTRKLMEAKAGYAHRLLDAVVQDDFEAIRDQAFRLRAVAETADWRVVDTPEYTRASDAFVGATERLLDAARESNGDAAALAYLDITLECVHCHRYIRNYRAAKAR